jgi:CDP-glucose 4,6-dehydratase
MKLNKKFWRNKNVFITGHTGFKGGWLCSLLNILHSNITGYSLKAPTKPNLFKEAKIKSLLKKDFRNNILQITNLKKALKKSKAEVVFHLAAQSSVIESFKNPHETILTNVVGTSNILEAVKENNKVKCLIIITTDKVYQNYKFKKIFNENSQLGGDDIYSGSKASCETITNSYKKSFFSKHKCKIATVRAGNCFGGGDWTKDRIVKDTMENFYRGSTLILRRPEATRPWQHVVEPIVGYLKLAEKLSSKEGLKYSGPWNFGPSNKQNLKVQELVSLFKSSFNSKSTIKIIRKNKKFYNKKIKIFESTNLNISSKKALKLLGWRSKLSVKEAVKLATLWYLDFKNKKNLTTTTRKQIIGYLDKN